MKPHRHGRNVMTRRKMLSLTANGFGAVALTSMMLRDATASPASLAAHGFDPTPHFTPKAKNVIFIFLSGGMSHIDTFDPKPRLYNERGQSPYDKFTIDRTQFENNGSIMPSYWDFKQYGEAGMWVSDLFPHMAHIMDDVALVRSMVAEFPEHANANFFIHTGMGDRGAPSMGAWVNYGLGSASDNLPGFVVVHGGSMPLGGVDMLQNGYLPTAYQPSIIRAQEEPLANILPREEQQVLQDQKLKYLSAADRDVLSRMGTHDQIESAINNYELAYRMQSSVPELADLSGESPATKKLYGFDSDDENTRAYAQQCLLARRLIERGVRFVEITDPFPGNPNPWDQHWDLKEHHERNAHAIDQPIAGLMRDMKARGLMDETLIVFATEFGRTFFEQGTDGRDHSTGAFSIWLAGAGIKAGTVYGTTDEYGYRVVDKPQTIRDLHATILHLLGIDHQRLTYPWRGRDVRLTDVEGEVIHGILES